MVISFDLDDTLIPGRKLFEIERRNFFQRARGIEKIRKGTVALIAQLKSQGHTVFVYTSSYRSTWEVWLTFLSYGIVVSSVINQTKHNKRLKERRSLHSKYPPAFGIDIHIDDSEGVRMEGERYNFKTIIIDENDSDWTGKIVSAVDHWK